ncbi:MAG: hypothetical protein ACPGXK_10955 [Phycisphaerae bacterium]
MASRSQRRRKRKQRRQLPSNQKQPDPHPIEHFPSVQDESSPGVPDQASSAVRGDQPVASALVEEGHSFAQVRSHGAKTGGSHGADLDRVDRGVGVATGRADFPRQRGIKATGTLMLLVGRLREVGVGNTALVLDSWAPVVTAGIIGISMAMLVTGYAAVLPDAEVPVRLYGFQIAGAALFLFSMGIRAPRFLVNGVLRVIESYFPSLWPTGAGGADHMAPTAERRRDGIPGHPQSGFVLHWTVLGALALLTGIAMALAPATVAASAWLWGWFAEGFVWSDLSIWAVSPFFAGFAMLLPCLLAAVCFSCAHRLAVRQNEAGIDPLTGLILGCGVGLLVAINLLSGGMAPWLMMVASSLGPLCVAVLAVAVMPYVSSPASIELDGMASVLRDRRADALLGRFMLPMATIVGVLMVLLRFRVEHAGWQFPGFACHLCFVGLGMAGARMFRGWTRLMTSVGVGLMMASTGYLASAIPVFWGDVYDAKGASASWLVSAYAVFMVCSGFTLQCGRMVLSQPSAVGAGQIGRRISRTGLVLGLSLVAVVPALMALVRASTVLAVTGMCLLAVGGTLVIHAPDESAAGKRTWLTTIFAGIGLIMLVSWYRA